jgi:hypothetical protein
VSVSLPPTVGLPNQKPPPDAPTGSLVALVKLVLNKNHAGLRAAAIHTFRCYLEENSTAQVKLVQGLSPKNPSDIGKMILNGILDLELSKKDAMNGWSACSLLLHALLRNAEAKEFALKIVFNEHGEEIPLLHKICYAMETAQKNNMDPAICAGILSLLTVWLFELKPAVKEFLSEGSNMQFVLFK